MSVRLIFFYYFVGTAFVVSCLSITAFVIVFDADWYEILFTKQLLSLPLSLFIIVSSMILGAIFSMIAGNFFKNKLEKVNTALLELANGNIQTLPQTDNGVEEITMMSVQIGHIQERLKEQVLLSQKMANERAAWSEKALKEVVSKERSRLARELHDSVSQQLFAASMLVAAINQQQDLTAPATKKQLTMIEGIITDAQSEMRALLLHLRPVQLEGKSLKSGIEELLRELSVKHSMEISWNIEEVELEKGVEDHLFRIVQEALSNTLRHAKAKSLEVLVKKFNQFILLKIVDDGIGFTMDQQKVGSYGLKNINERVSEIGGTVKIISFPNKGTSVEVRVPIFEKKDGSDDKGSVS
ncbi:sensor histidine kinase [Bacillus aquiflavi]|uniref:sensor histidine kinase n=1 Tax=Bacillus aquiflavi TaxID=2672567 RepID=UPI001CA9A295|nr:sensor histidine kinase [Bacillus aquiflavi]UAC48895.1 sensor histidine kinase [Bacillus aquiflavi]